MFPDPIPAGQSVYDNMPGHEVEALPKDGPETYFAQLRSKNTWVNPNHDENECMPRWGIGKSRLRGWGRPARMSVADDGIVYLSNGVNAARSIPVEHMAGFTPGHCPGCGTPNATNGDGPCPASGIEMAEQHGTPTQPSQPQQPRRTFGYRVPGSVLVQILADSPAEADEALAEMVGERFSVAFTDGKGRHIAAVVVDEADPSHLDDIDSTELFEWCDNPACRRPLTAQDRAQYADQCTECRSPS